jgi:hypothetical protein
MADITLWLFGKLRVGDSVLQMSGEGYFWAGAALIHRDFFYTLCSGSRKLG